MAQMTATREAPSYLAVTLLTYFMFFMFAMTTESIGEVIKLAKAEMGLTNIQASALHWSTMSAIALSGIFLGFVADKFGRKYTVMGGLLLYGLASGLFLFQSTFLAYVVLLFCTGIAIGLFKTAALALIGDITTSADHHTKKMNMVEGFFGVGAIFGPLLVVLFNEQGLRWNYLYALAAFMCFAMILAAAMTQYPTSNQSTDSIDLRRSFKYLGNRYAMGFSFACAMYVGCEVAIFVWLPSFLEGYTGSPFAMKFAAYAVMIFFVLRALGRFLGVWLLNHFDWKLVMLGFSLLIFVCFLASAVFGQSVALYSLPLTGLFMSMIYPTLNSKGISCFPKSEHGSVAGVILFFTAASAAIAPLMMAYAADLLGGGNLRVGFSLATLFAAALMIMAIYNFIYNPAGETLTAADD
ncbi:MAG: MFS transporter [Pseudomonadota bacterium]